MTRWTIKDDWDLPPHGYSHQPFIAFTRNIWLAISNNIVSKPLLPDPQTLEDAMKVWSVEAVSNLLGDNRILFFPPLII